MADPAFENHPEREALTTGQQNLARNIVAAGYASADDVIQAFVNRENGKIGRWKALLDGNPSRVPPPRTDDRASYEVRNS